MNIDYYYAPHSPWTYLGHERFTDIARLHGASVNLKPVDLGDVFPATGGLPLAKRAPQRQAYRLVELERFSQWLRIPLNPKPRYFPVVGDSAARLVIAVQRHDGTDAAMRIAGGLLRAVWAEDRDIADDTTLASLLADHSLPAGRLDESREPAVNVCYARFTNEAIACGVFGAPSYVIGTEIFWGQDRLDFVERRLSRG